MNIYDGFKGTGTLHKNQLKLVLSDMSNLEHGPSNVHYFSTGTVILSGIFKFLAT